MPNAFNTISDVATEQNAWLLWVSTSTISNRRRQVARSGCSQSRRKAGRRSRRLRGRTWLDSRSGVGAAELARAFRRGTTKLPECCIGYWLVGAPRTCRTAKSSMANSSCAIRSLGGDRRLIPQSNHSANPKNCPIAWGHFSLRSLSGSQSHNSTARASPPGLPTRVRLGAEGDQFGRVCVTHKLCIARVVEMGQTRNLGFNQRDQLQDPRLRHAG